MKQEDERVHAATLTRSRVRANAGRYGNCKLSRVRYGNRVRLRQKKARIEHGDAIRAFGDGAGDGRPPDQREIVLLKEPAAPGSEPRDPEVSVPRRIHVRDRHGNLAGFRRGELMTSGVPTRLDDA